ncbi:MULTISPECIES: YraN family protein [unclassified Streptomyces]|jgi:putative endonuclease|uniref:YraN family protein n=1 Tax=Streptomyces TaxID=1883 RepID=UPI001906712D|nr:MULTISPECIES: YraN family protein [unclassified Streptomyces]MCU4750147.1 YraN family protein [Streptomyces sp. G-5]QQN76962.1 YraN family protein [Streptomyces sp. XC 2026]
MARATGRTGGQRGALGRFGEDLAVRRLVAAGTTVLERNWRCRAGEIDIVAREPGRAGALLVCEVKTRRGTGFQHPMAGVTPSKAERLRRLAEWWLSERWLPAYGTPPAGGVRIDLIGVLLPRRGAPVVEHAKGVA